MTHTIPDDILTAVLKVSEPAVPKQMFYCVCVKSGPCKKSEPTLSWLCIVSNAENGRPTVQDQNLPCWDIDVYVELLFSVWDHTTKYSINQVSVWMCARYICMNVVLMANVCVEYCVYTCSIYISWVCSIFYSEQAFIIFCYVFLYPVLFLYFK